MAILIRNAWLVETDPPQVRRGDLRLDCGVIAASGTELEKEAGDEVTDAGGAVVMPGFVNGHGHLYSALAVGMPPPLPAPRDFRQILQSVWWRLDRALDLELVETSATIGAIEALRCGTTTIIDHHSSPVAIDGSLDAVEAGLTRIGIRGVLCYEVTDRNGPQGRAAGLAENGRYLGRCDRRETREFGALVGGHAAFTMGGDALAAVGDLARRFGVGVHMHVAEDPCDASMCRDLYGAELLDRLDRAGILSLPSVLAHGTHLSGPDIARVNASVVAIAHNPRSNMNNAVGYSQVGRLARPAMLGTDGVGSDMFAELGAAWLQSRDHHAGLTMNDCVAMLAASAKRARKALRLDLGRFTVGAAGDVVVTDYVPATPLTPENLPAHLVYGMSSRHVASVLVDGEWRLRNRRLVNVDEQRVRAQAALSAVRLWGAMSEVEG